MKFIYTFLPLIFGLFISLNAQIPNAGFENWTNGEPNSWETNNSKDFYTTITQSNSAHTGSSALKGEVANVPGFGFIGPLIIADDGSPSTQGFNINQKYNSMKGYYKLNTTVNDNLVVILVVYSGDVGIGTGIGKFNAAASYTQFAFPILYQPGFNGVPDRCAVAFQFFDVNGDAKYTLGTEMYIDDLELSMDIVSDVEDKSTSSSLNLEQNSPNPFHSTTNINFEIPKTEMVTIKVYDVLGNDVATLVNEEMTAGSHVVTFNAPSGLEGVYFYKLISGNINSTKKMLLFR
jgi:hypothetical protein